MRSRYLQSLALVAVVAVGVPACGGEEAAEETEQPAAMDAAPAPAEQEMAMANLPEGVTQDQVAQGRQLFSGQGGCHACHGPDATGTQLAPDLTDDEWINVSGPNMDEVVQLINNGVPQPKQHPAPMPAMGGANLNPEQVRALAAYVVALGHN